MGQSTGEQATEPSCRTQKTHKALCSGQLMGHSGRTGHTAPEGPSDHQGPWWGQGRGLVHSESVFLLERKTRNAKDRALATELICQQVPVEQIHTCPSKISTKTPRGRRSQKPKLPEAHGCERTRPLRGQGCSPRVSQCFCRLCAFPHCVCTHHQQRSSMGIKHSQHDKQSGVFLHVPNTK